MIFITGGSGHLGNVLIRKLKNSGERIVALVHPKDNCVSLEGLDVKIVKGDIRDYETVKKFARNADLIIHLAAYISILPWKKKKVFSVNVNGTRNIINICMKTGKRLIYVSSVHAFEEPRQRAIINEETKIDPKKTSGVYGKSKATAALEILNAAKAGLDVVTICPTGIIGPYDFKPSEMGKFFLKYLSGKLKYIIDGSFDFVDVRDVADGIIALSEKGKKGEFYILGNKTFSITEIVKLLNKITGYKTIPKIINQKLAYSASLFSITFGLLTNNTPIFTPYSIHTLTRNYTFSHEKAKKEINYTPRPIGETLFDTLNWFKYSKEKLLNFTHLYHT
ncbi:epimerase [Thermosipho melanesiensis]|uniref:NAD-dependent epimerase/dehydratase n=2 Tax=Thermosipho melanesiensis TaxID=46541 RepID=A6LP17_THEM4|nr:NAD-dependent epimerase/dehydratase family protein [Thermosipho melanesiensis]ABR31668.1 NAD-dependent epimerase/dehydratase [Thermosipho melanesiensis BI429]APT74695.1 epimerase [Thermosipho melanesiensis]OOC35192.1 epimerase [Thermosipho melanesiensis]OOC35402.1 epimerase [Thermosipho melanesiensis]OOC36653.1 epimerase [Thermosipho melanesiensis]